MTKGVNAQSGNELAESWQGDVEADKKVTAIGTPYAQEGILNEIINLETEIEFKSEDYQTMISALTHTKEKASKEKKEPLKLRVARWLVDRPKRSPQKIGDADLTNEKRDLIKTESDELLSEIERMIARREELKKMLKPEDLAELEGRKEESRLKLIIGGVRKSVAKITVSGKVDTGSEEMTVKYQEFIDGLNLSEQNTEKLKEMVSDAKYQKAVEVAKELEASKIPSKTQILAELMKWSPEKLKNICEMQAEPRVVIESDQSFDDQVAAMDAHKYYTSKTGRSQENAFVNTDVASPYRSPYRNVPKSKKVIVSITDGVVHPTQLNGVSRQWGERRAYLVKEYAKKGMKLANKAAMAALTQMSLIEAKETGDNNKIIDNWETGNGTATILDPDTLTKPALVACSLFGSVNRRVGFLASGPVYDNVSARGRASVPVLEI